MNDGYSQFFREAQKSAGLTNGSGKKSPPTKKQPAKFQLQSSSVSQKNRRQSIENRTPEQRLRMELAERLNRRKKAASGRRKKLPIYPVVCAAMALVTCTIAYMKSDLMDEWLEKVEVSAFGFAGAAENSVNKAAPSAAAPAPAKAEKNSSGPNEKTAKGAETKGAAKAAEVPNTKGWSPEEMSFFSKLNERKKELDLREAELGKLEEELQKRKSELDEKLKSLESMRTEIAKTLKTRVAEDQQKVDKLVQVYSSMKAQQAAKVIETLNEDLAVEILEKLKKKNAAEILDMMNAKKARKLSELLTGYQRSTASVGGEESSDSDAPQGAGGTKPSEPPAQKATK